jgi:hypothetical protein
MGLSSCRFNEELRNREADGLVCVSRDRGTSLEFVQRQDLPDDIIILRAGRQDGRRRLSLRLPESDTAGRLSGHDSEKDVTEIKRGEGHVEDRGVEDQ